MQWPHRCYKKTWLAGYILTASCSINSARRATLCICAQGTARVANTEHTSAGHDITVPEMYKDIRVHADHLFVRSHVDKAHPDMACNAQRENRGKGGMMYKMTCPRCFFKSTQLLLIKKTYRVGSITSNVHATCVDDAASQLQRSFC